MKQITMKIVIDIEGLIDFYKDENNDDWGGYKNPCSADPFCVIMAGNSTYSGSYGNIMNWEPYCEYTWEVYDLEFKKILMFDEEIVMEMIQDLKGKGEPQRSDWEDIFDIRNDREQYNAQEGKLYIKEIHTHSIDISTKEKIDKDYNLKYTIKFKFKDDKNIDRHGQIDPFVKVRSDPKKGNLQ